VSATVALQAPNPVAEPERKSSFAFKAVMAISILYYARPEDVIPGLNYVPMVKIAGILAIIALIFGMQQQRAVKGIPVANKLHLLLFAQMVFAIPFAYWKGGAFNTVFFRFTKGVIVGLLVALLVTTFAELRRLLWIQAASLAFMTMASIAQHNKHARMTGALGGVFENPNDLAINIALNWPLCFAFFLLADKAWKKAFWGVSMLVMVMGVILTYSRSGFLAIIICAAVSLYQFGIKGKRIHLLAMAVVAPVLLAVVAPAVGLYPKVWIARMESTVLGNIKDSHDKGSKEARTELLKISLKEMAAHPIAGVGPGNFQIFGDWHVAHNTYSEIGAEAGVPALIIFILFLGRSLVNLRKAAKSEEYKRNPELQIFTGAMYASVSAFLVGAAFSSTQYELFPYFMVAYTTVLYHMACVFPKNRPSEIGQPAQVKESRVSASLDYPQSGRREAAWLR
jgi:putative inorganic carbon (hco3(-)) transporter